MSAETLVSLRQVAESLSQAMCTCGPAGGCEYVSPRWVEFTGANESQLRGDGLWQRLHPGDRSRVDAAWRSALSRGTRFEWAARVRRHDDSFHWFESQAVPLRDDAGRIERWLVTSAEAARTSPEPPPPSERPERRAATLEAARSPLGVITGTAYLLGRTTLSGGQRDLLRSLDTSAKRLVEILHEAVDGPGPHVPSLVPEARTDSAAAAWLEPVHTASSTPAVALRGTRVLIVDDSDINSSIARRILELEGAETEVARDGQQALSLLGNPRQELDAVLMDVQMPRMDGLQATRLLRAIPGRRSLPVIAMTVSLSDRERALRAGMNDFVAKPIVPALLLQTLRSHVRPAGPATAHALARTQDVAADWPAVDGVDAVDSFVRLCGDRELFVTLLGRLDAQLSSLLDDLSRRPPLDAGELSSRMHRLRGAAGNLGARDLQAVAARLEADCRGGSKPSAAELTKLREQASRLRASATEVLPHTPREPAAEPTRNDGDLHAFVRCLREQDLQALSLFPALASRLEPNLGPHAHRALEQALKQLDFDRALAILEELPST